MKPNEATAQSIPERAAGQRPRPRAGPRININRRAVLVMPKTGQPHPVLLRNISVGGACVQTDVCLSIGDEIRLRVDFDPENKVVLKALVIGIRPPRQGFYTEYGLRIVGNDEAAAAALTAFVGLKATGRA